MKILFIGWNGWGHVNPTLSLINQLLRDNEVFYLNSSRYTDIVNAMGAKVVINKYMNLVYKFFQPDGFQLSKMSENVFLQRVSQFYCNLDYLYVLLGQVKKIIVELEPDLVMHDSCAHVVKYLCNGINIPRATISTLFAITREMFFVEDGLFENLYNLRLSSTVKEVLKKVDEMAYVSKNKNGYFYDYFDGFSSKGDLNLVFTSREFQPYPYLLDQTYKFIGNDLRYRSKRENRLQLKVTNKKYILLSLGSCLCGVESYKKFYYEFMNYFGTYDAIFILVIGEMNFSDIGKIPHNFFVYRSVPQLSVLAQVDLFITHGGFNSISEAIINQVPMIVIPQIGDQFMNANQVKKHNMGIVNCYENINFVELEKNMNEILNNPQYGKSTKEIAETYFATDQNDYAIKAICDYVKNEKRRRI